MASKRFPKKEVTFTLAVAALLIDVFKAMQHQQTCPKCRGRDFLTIAFDVAHLLEAA